MLVRFRANLPKKDPDVRFRVGEDGRSFGLKPGQKENGFEFRSLESRGLKHQATLVASPPKLVGPDTKKTITLTFKVSFNFDFFCSIFYSPSSPYLFLPFRNTDKSTR